MDLKVKSYNIYKTENKNSMALLFSIISMLVCVLYSISFIGIGANNAAFIQLIGAFVFMTIVGLMRRRIYGITRYLSILTSIALVFIQSTIVFGKVYGFHYQLFALLVVVYIILDFNIKFEKILIYIFSLTIIALFFICEWSSFTPVFREYMKYSRVYYTFALSFTFIGLLVILHYLSTEIFSARAQLYSMATTDVLTSLYNRRTYIKRGEETFKIAERGGNTFSVLLFDIDSFKDVNEDYGHVVGDEVIKNISKLARNSLRDTDLIARYGGEEFAVLLHNTSSDHALYVAEKLRTLIRDHIVIVTPHKISKSISVGVISYHYSIDSFSTMMEMADKALYQSKLKGKNQTTVYNPASPVYREKR